MNYKIEIDNFSDFLLLLPEGVLLLSLLSTLVLHLIFRTAPHRKLGQIIFLIVICILLYQWPKGEDQTLFILLCHDRFGQYIKIILACGAWLTLSIPSIHISKKEEGEYLFLVYAITLGGFLLVASIHFMSLLVTLEMVSLGSYMLVGFGRKKVGAEGSVKYFLMGATSSAIMIYGMSLWVPFTDSFYYYAHDVSVGEPRFFLILAGCLILSGLLFKISAFPFHFWSPDVYASASLPVVAFISVVPKIAGFGMLLRLVFTFQKIFLFQDGFLFSVLAISSILIGTLTALFQREAKRMMAWSSIAQTGFMLISVITISSGGITSFLFYSTGYMIANFVVFMGFRQDSSDDLIISTYTKPYSFFPVLWLSIGFMSLTGLPITMGFTSKLILFSVLWDHWVLYANGFSLLILFIGIISAIASVFFYFKIPYQLFIKHPNQAVFTNSLTPDNIIASVLAIVLLYLFFQPDKLMSILNSITF